MAWPGGPTACTHNPSPQVTRAGLFDPPPFRPDKLTVMFSSPGVSKGSLPSTRRYTLTHNDITGALRLTVGPDYNYQQISGFYTRLLRDEVVAEWRFGGPQPSLHIYCHVSGEEKWLAPPMLRNYIFRREMPLVSGRGGQGGALGMLQQIWQACALAVRPCLPRLCAAHWAHKQDAG